MRSTCAFAAPWEDLCSRRFHSVGVLHEKAYWEARTATGRARSGQCVQRLHRFDRENEGDEVVVGDASEVARFVNKDGEFAHDEPPFLQKNAGGKTPALGGPSFGGNRILYTMR